MDSDNEMQGVSIAIVMGTIFGKPQKVEVQKTWCTLFRIAVGRPESITDQAKHPPIIHKIIAYGTIGEEVHSRCRDGDRIHVEGRMENRTIERKEIGKDDKHLTYKAIEIIARRITFIDTSGDPHPETEEEDITPS